MFWKFSLYFYETVVGQQVNKVAESALAIVTAQPSGRLVIFYTSINLDVIHSVKS